jgi:hypothetical protein
VFKMMRSDKIKHSHSNLCLVSETITYICYKILEASVCTVETSAIYDICVSRLEQRICNLRNPDRKHVFRIPAMESISPLNSHYFFFNSRFRSTFPYTRNSQLLH